jgi:hypothetical protein
LIFKIVTGSKILTALAWALSFLGAMQLAYLAGALVFSLATMKLNELYLRVGELIYNRT